MNRKLAALRASLAAVVVATLSLLAVPATAQVQSPAKGSPLRATLMDALRPAVVAEVGGKVEFVVDEIRVLGEWAFVLVRPQRPGGKPIEWVYTRYQSAIDAGAFGGMAAALLRQTPRGWLVYQYALGFSDVAWADWGSFYPVPPEVFP